MKIKVFTDGACKQNPGGLATYGFVVKIYKGKETPVHLEKFGVLGEYGDAEAAEMGAVKKALLFLQEKNLHKKNVVLYTDSSYCFYRLIGENHIKCPLIKKIRDDNFKLLQNFKRFRVKWIPREKNRRADRLSKKAYYYYGG